MAMPKNLIIVRHGESEGNVHSKRGIVVIDRHDSELRLTQKGIFQAHEAGKWIAGELSELHGCFVSPFIRAKEGWAPRIKTSNWLENL